VLNEQEISEIIGRVRGRVEAVEGRSRTGPALRAAAESAALSSKLGDGIYANIDEAISAARRAFFTYRDMGLEKRRVIVDAMRSAMLADGERLAYLAREETGLGRAEDKILKNRLVTIRTPGPEDLEPQAVTGDSGMMVTEFAPYGVIGSISPTTNPTSTVINNAIAIISAGNAVTFNVHPSAKDVSVENIQVLNRAIMSAGGPPDLITAIAEPTLESAKRLMAHPDVPVLLVTGGPGVVREALAMTSHGAYRLKEHELKRLERVIFREMGPQGKPGIINPAWIGKDAGAILAEIGVSVDTDLRLLVAEVPAWHNLVWTEQMMPVMPVVRVKDVDSAIDLAVRSEHGFRHSASIHSTNVDTITHMAREMNCSIFIANGPNISGLGDGGEGFSSFSIASPTGEGLTRPRTFSRIRRVTVVGAMRIV
jgi:aldehyde dehydrogenase